MERACDYCGQTYTAKRKTSRFCSNSHRALYAQKGGDHRPVAVVRPQPRPSVSLAASTRAALEQAGRLDHPAGVAALRLAELVDDPPPLSTSSIAAWVREHRASMAEALKDATPAAASTLDMLKARRDARRHA